MTDDAVDILLDMKPMVGLRRSVRLSQRALAELLGCSRAAVSNYERGLRPMPLARAVLASRLMGFPLFMFYDVVDVEIPSSKP